MYFIHDKKNKILYGWSAKSGCSHIKKIIKFLMYNKLNATIHTNDEYGPYEAVAETIILIVRNPYERLVSGFVDKYTKPGHYINRWRSNTDRARPLTFRYFVEELVQNRFRAINEHHFTPQLSEAWSDDIKHHKNVIIYDIKAIDYAYLESRYGVKIPQELLDFRGGHENVKCRETNIQAADTDFYLFPAAQQQPFWQDFYRDGEIKRQVEEFYAKDFDYFDYLGIFRPFII
jgi:hypothetical protein